MIQGQQINPDHTDDDKALFALYNAAKVLLALMDDLPEEAGGQQDRVFAEYEFDDLRAAVEQAEKLTRNATA